MVATYRTAWSRLLKGLVVALLSFLTIATLAVGVALWVTRSVPDGSFAALHLPLSGGHDAALFDTAHGRFALGAVTLENVIVTMVILFTLLSVLRTTTRGTPFVEANVGRLRLIAAAYAVSLAAKCVVPFLVPTPVAAWLATIGWSFNLGDLGALLVAAVLAEVFREGVHLREDSDATV